MSIRNPRGHKRDLRSRAPKCSRWQQQAPSDGPSYAQGIARLCLIRQLPDACSRCRLTGRITEVLHCQQGSTALTALLGASRQPVPKMKPLCVCTAPKVPAAWTIEAHLGNRVVRIEASLGQTAYVLASTRMA